MPPIVPRTRTEPRRVVIVARDLITASRIGDAAVAAGFATSRVDGPDELPPPPEVAVAFVDWDDRQPGWATTLQEWQRRSRGPAPRLVLLGSHRDLAGHHEARAAGLGPMIARSKLFASLPSLLRA